MCITWIIHQQLCGYIAEEKKHLGVREQKGLNTTALSNVTLDGMIEEFWNINDLERTSVA
jgi:hypothetical protein